MRPREPWAGDCDAHEGRASRPRARMGSGRGAWWRHCEATRRGKCDRHTVTCEGGSPGEAVCGASPRLVHIKAGIFSMLCADLSNKALRIARVAPAASVTPPRDTTSAAVARTANGSQGAAISKTAQYPGASVHQSRSRRARRGCASWRSPGGWRITEDRFRPRAVSPIACCGYYWPDASIFETASNGCAVCVPG